MKTPRPHALDPHKTEEFPLNTMSRLQDSTSRRQSVADLAVWRERRSWAAAAAWLNREGLAACVPCELLTVLRRLGLVVWCQERAA